MSENKMRSKKEILRGIFNKLDDENISINIYNLVIVLTDIRDILNEWMSKGGDVHRVAEEVIKDAAIKVGDEIVCEHCGELMPASDIYYVLEAGHKKKIEHVCKNCISFVDKLKKED